MSFSFFDILIVIIGIFVLGIILKFIGKLVCKLLSAAFVIVFVLYLLFYWNGGLLDLGNQNFMLYELEAKYCGDKDRQTSCCCIVQPLIEDVTSKYEDEEIEDFQKSKITSIRIIMESLMAKKQEIATCLKENDALDEWDNFISDLEKIKAEQEEQGED
ncbi:MAG: hypothetical protein CSA05_03305 [Bacteroidia bacterium]|nr:MAG: hypothetical protein CSA05_03305 [Bacteroidia bacterium]